MRLFKPQSWLCVFFQLFLAVGQHQLRLNHISVSLSRATLDLSQHFALAKRMGLNPMGALIFFPVGTNLELTSDGFCFSKVWQKLSHSGRDIRNFLFWPK